ncbi:hypothetical protein SAMN04487905_10194 [Actinopolyspora xinjiangensis]|uniref:Uncharacterized protein n=1 Tax=Actinopolyspora xinjiangensis TaxID=405564 RepID=A0A1H0NDN4_9ACTN|nr:hypothetical protein [Actinopolyspora xinjiangensis]SDO90741.1 hypothetical protein SAMN04487905_10194 [Actinopolyspora xinjiangensis]
MNSESVPGWLETMGVPSRVVSVGAETDDAWCLLREDSEGQPVWDVFWREQGNRYDWARFSDERVACFYLFGRLTWTQALRGAVGPLDSGSTPPRGVPIPGGSADPGSGSPGAGSGPVTPATGNTPATPGAAAPGTGNPATGNPAAATAAGHPPERDHGDTPEPTAESDAVASTRETSGTEQGTARPGREPSGG